MKTRRQMIFALTLAAMVSVAIATVARPRPDRAEAGELKQIVVLIHRSPKGLEYEMKSYHLKKAMPIIGSQKSSYENAPTVR